ncbi:hypothetical protein [Hahella sp. CCB-MM4]|uniref:hypothetical protein n=1 Tax=Hahella sp. (strain CCB-MM4) TaxID=1926491 RepID=UPI0011408B2D|nr:hypothetical protein [Hahella sp. CCB-MM4]
MNIGFLSGMLFAVPFGWWLGHWYYPVNGSRASVEVIFTSNVVSLLSAMSSGLMIGVLSHHFTVWTGLMGGLLAWFLVFPFVMVLGGIGGMILRHRFCSNAKPSPLTLTIGYPPQDT